MIPSHLLVSEKELCSQDWESLEGSEYEVGDQSSSKCSREGLLAIGVQVGTRIVTTLDTKTRATAVSGGTSGTSYQGHEAVTCL